jgi:hypothetical protein
MRERILGVTVLVLVLFTFLLLLSLSGEQPTEHKPILIHQH